GSRRGVLRMGEPQPGEASGYGSPCERERATLSRLSRAPYLRRWALILALERVDGGDIGDQALGVRHPEEPLERRAPVVPQPHRVVVHVHEDEATARLLVDAAAIAHGVLDG